MKKVILFMAIAAAVTFSNCSKDDDDKTCASCTVDFLGTSIGTEACNNGDGTVTVTSAGQSETLTAADLEEAGVTAAEYVQALEDECP